MCRSAPNAQHLGNTNGVFDDGSYFLLGFQVQKRQFSSCVIAMTYAERRVCAFKGSSVNLSCKYQGYEYIASKFWFNPERSLVLRYRTQHKDLSKDPRYEGRVKVVETKGGRSTLTITDLRESDSDEYLFKFNTPSFEWRSGLPGTTLTVTDGPRLPSVSVSPSEIVEGSSVTLTCSSDANPAASYTWYKKNQPRPHGEEPQLVFSSIQSSDSGQYLCEAENHLGKKRSEFISIDVKYGPKLPSVSVSPSEIVEGSSVTLTCSSDANPAANYTWYKKNQPRPHGEEPQLVFSSIQSSDSGQYLCEAENHLGKKRSEFISIDVKYGPRLPSVSVSPSEIVEGSSVTLSCSSDANPAANYTWYKKNQTSPHGEGDIYCFTSISSEDRGIYYCKAENQHEEITSSSLVIDVQCEYQTH
uniref:Ig-like domain-containing protein n=1 Tax=Cyclopterus lumpus TaxID=8103 RepID=A0A8C2Z597_CYCLU